MTQKLKQKIIEHLHGLNKLDEHTDAENLVTVLAQHYDAPEEIVRHAIAEWSAGRRKALDKSEENET